MARKDDLEQNIRSSYELIKENEDILRTTERPEERQRAARMIGTQWLLIREFLDEYDHLSQRLRFVIPEDIKQIRARFHDYKPGLSQVVAKVKGVVPWWVMGILVVLAGLVGFYVAQYLPQLRPTFEPTATIASSPTSTPTATPGQGEPSASPPEAEVSPISLISLRYQASNYDPRLVDLRTAASSGIPVTAGQTLQLRDLWLWASGDVSDYSAQAEVYADANAPPIGATSFRSLTRGAVDLGDVVPRSFQDGERADAWRVQENWTDLLVVLVVYRKDEVVELVHMPIHLDITGTAWLLDPPHASIVSVVYAIGDGPKLVLDLRGAQATGLDAQPGNLLELSEIWYHADMSTDKSTVQAEAYLSPNGFDPDTYKATRTNTIQKGIHPLDFAPLSWQVPDGSRYLVLSLARDDGVVMDRLVVPLGSSESPGLVPQAPSACTYLYDRFFDFEDDSDFEGWSGKVQASTDHTFSGNRALQASVKAAADKQVLTNWVSDYTADRLLVHYYLPESPNVHVEWMQVCIPIGPWHCWTGGRTLGVWHTILIDLSKTRYYTGETLDQLILPALTVQSLITSTDTTDPVPYSVYLDAIHILEDDEP